MSIVLAEIDSTCSYLGSFVDDEYKITTDSISCLKHLIWFLRHDGDTHEYRRHIGQSKILQKDLLPMLVSNSDNIDLSHVLLRLLVNLSYPALLLYREELPKDGPGRRNFLEIVEILQSYKEGFASKQVWIILGVYLQKVLEIDVALRADSDSLLIERVLSLIRNILQVPVNPSTENRADNDASVHDQVLWSLQQSGVLDLILYILASEFENVYHLHALEIIYLVYREQTPESLANALMQRSDTEKQQDEQELISILRREKEEKLKHIPNSRHSRFGGCYVLKDVKSISENDLICHQPIDKAYKMEFDREKNRKKKSHRIAKEENVVQRRSAFSIRLFLREFCLEILHSAFNKFVTSIRATVERETSGGHDDSYLLWAMSFFMEFNRLSNFRLELISESLSLTSFHWVLTRIQFNMDMITSDKKNSRLWSRRLHLGIKVYRELLYSLHTLQKFKDDDKSQGLYRMIQNNIFYVLEHRETMLHLIINYKEANSTKAYLRDVIETAHTFFKMMEKFSAGGIVVQQKKRRKNKSNVQKADNRKNNVDDEQEVQDKEQLENHWVHIMPQLSIVLSNENLKLPGDEQIVPFDATSDKPIDDQKGDCMLKIYEHLKEEQYEHAVCMLRAGREVWMEDDCFGSFASAPEDELMILKEIFFSNLSYNNKEKSSKRNNKEGADMGITTAPEMMDDNVDNKANDNDRSEEVDDGYGEDEELHDEEEDEEPEFTETNFKFEEFIKRLLHPNVVRACTMMLTDWEQITSRALKSAVTILHRIAVGCNMPVMLFQASLFRIFQNVLNLKRDPHNEELQRIARHIVRKFIEMAPKNPKIYAELLFYKSLKESYDVEFIYEDHDIGGKNQWTEEDENELRELFMENQRNPESDQDVIDWLTNNLSNKTRTRRAVIKKLKELNLIFKAPTKKTYATAAALFQWSVDQDTHLKTLYQEYRFDKAPLKRIYEAFGSGAVLEGSKKRTKPAIIKRMIELGLIADKTEIQPSRQKKNESSNGMHQGGSTDDSSGDDDDDNGGENEGSEEEVDFNELRRALNPQRGENNNTTGNRGKKGGGSSKKIKKLSSLSKKASKKPKRPKQQIKPLNIVTVKQLIEDLTIELSEAISWLQESFDDAAEDHDDISSDPDDAVPIVPITEGQTKAFDDPKFIELLREMHINEPLKEMETYWRIPIHFTVNDLKIRSQLLTGLYEDTVLEQEIYGANEEDVDDATHNDNNNEDDESENEINKTNSGNPFDKLRRIMYNNSDNEEDDRSSGKSRFNFGRRNNFDKDTDNFSVITEGSTNLNVENKTNSDDDNEELTKEMDDENVEIRKITKRVNRLIDSSDSESDVLEITTKTKRQRLELKDNDDDDDDAMDSYVGGINSHKRIRRISSSSEDE